MRVLKLIPLFSAQDLAIGHFIVSNALHLQEKYFFSTGVISPTLWSLSVATTFQLQQTTMHNLFYASILVNGVLMGKLSFLPYNSVFYVGMFGLQSFFIYNIKEEYAYDQVHTDNFDSSKYIDSLLKHLSEKKKNIAQEITKQYVFRDIDETYSRPYILESSPVYNIFKNWYTRLETIEENLQVYSGEEGKWEWKKAKPTLNVIARVIFDILLEHNPSDLDALKVLVTTNCFENATDHINLVLLKQDCNAILSQQELDNLQKMLGYKLINNPVQKLDVKQNLFYIKAMLSLADAPCVRFLLFLRLLDLIRDDAKKILNNMVSEGSYRYLGGLSV